MAAFKREDWNEVIRDVNEVLENPPEDSDCDPIEPLEEVEPEHRWAKSDIRAVQDKIKETCPEITFAEIPDLWKQEILDEIYEKLEEAWCDCDCAAESEHGTQFTIMTAPPPRVTSNCLGDVFVPAPVCNLIHGMQVGVPGICNRQWRLLIKRVYNDGHMDQSTLLNGSINCDGTVQCTSSLQMDFLNGGLTPNGIFISCGTCNASCDDSIAESEQYIADHPEEFFTASLVLEIRSQAVGATCCECE